ncbi:hypothetical protein BH09SUM1_BH09SUM1_24480 [soil metagenome]
MADHNSDKHSSESGVETRSAVNYPILLTGNCRRAIVVGGGKVATRKIRALLAAGIEVEIIAPDITEELQDHAEAGDLHWHDVPYALDVVDLTKFDLLFAATDVRTVNAAAAKDGRSARVLVNVADDPDACDFFTPAALRNDSDGVIIAVSSTTGNPTKARDWKNRIKLLLGN